MRENNYESDNENDSEMNDETKYNFFKIRF